MNVEAGYFTMGRAAAGPIEAAGRELIDAGLLRGDSAFTPGQAVWTPEALAELKVAYVDQPDISGASFEDKLSKQLAGATDPAVQLFAEIFYLNVLPLSDYKGDTKRKLLRFVLDKMSSPESVPDHLDAPLDLGVFNGGVAFKTRRYQQLALLVEFARRFLHKPYDVREAAMRDPLGFRGELAEVTDHNEPAQRNSLLYLAFPDYFLPIANSDHRRQIRNAFQDRAGESTGDIDIDLHTINQAMVKHNGGPVDYYHPPWRAQWDPKTTGPGDPAAPPSDKWGEFMLWAARVNAAVDLEVEERGYKVEMAERLSGVRDLVLADDPAWPEQLRKALGSTNLLPTFFRIAFFNDLRDHAGGVRAALMRLWDEPPSPVHFDQLQVDLKALSRQSSYTAGNAAALGSVLSMARDLGQFPPYRPTPVAKACQLTGEVAKGSTPGERYETLLALCDELMERAADFGIELRDRLDAQSLIWAVVSYDPPSSWNEAERAAFRAWRGDPAEPAGEQRRAWLVRGANVNGRDLVPAWLEKGTVSLAGAKLREVEPGISRDELKQIVDDDYAHTSYSQKAEKLDEFHAFLSRIQAGDLVATTSQGRLYLGRIVGPATYLSSADARSNLRRDVEWAGDRQGIDYADLPPEVASRLQVQRDVLDLTQQMDALEALRDTEVVQAPPPPIESVVLRRATPDLGAALHVSEEWLQLCIDLLNDRPQLIFYGPPGTGKTYIAQHLAEHVARDNVRLVQFHPAYSYEDFFEGFRPVASGGFDLRPGPMRKIVDQALDSPTVPHVLIIDEINRGNLAKVFGELYFLLEYRDKNVDLLYASDDDKGFTLPRNVYIIGTMNTADRSIALVDAAMRRRFAFLSLHPSEPPISAVLRSWLRLEGHPARVADLLDELNARIEDDDFKVGPSYFMRPAVHAGGGLERTWNTSILPLLEEHHYGELTSIQVELRYGLANVAAHVDARAAAQPDVENAADAPPDAD